MLREPGLAYPPPAAPPTSPSQLYTLLLQRNIRPPEYTLIEPRSQTFPPNYFDWNSPNILPPRTIYQNEYRRELHDIREREQVFYRPLTNVRHRFEHFGHVERKPFLNQNYPRLPYNMVRIKNTNGDSEDNTMNGFTEDDEGNHECHDLRHEHLPVLESPMASGIDHHHGDLLQMGTSELPEANGVPNLSTIYQGEWPMHRALWMSGPSSIGEKDPLDGFGGDDTESIMSFSSSTATMSARRPHTHQLGTKVEMVYSLLSMLGSCNKEDMSRTLLEMSNNQDSCIAMRQSGCLPLLIQLLHGSERDQVLSEHRSSANVKWAVREARRRASQALHNIVHAHPDDRRGRREARVLRLLEQIRDYSDFLRDLDATNVDFSHNENLDLHPGPAIAALMKLSFDEEHRHAMCQLGGLQAIAELIQADHEVHGNTSDQFCVTVRRYAGMALTNLTFGDGTNKALLCSMKPFMQALVAQLHSPSEDLRQVTASVLRNLSWRADASSKQILREVGVVTTLMEAAMEANKESTLKSILSALWNLSAHCSMNKADICEIEGALEFLVSTLTYKSASNTLSIIENGGGILRNVSSHIAVREDYRAVLRKHKCLQTLLCHLKSPSLTIVSNACGTLWNLSARCAEDQKALWEMGAVGMLRNLVHSKHKMISMGSSAALKNLLTARPEGLGLHSENGHHMNGSMTNMPSLLVRKQKALAADIDENLSETCENIDSPKTSPTPQHDFSRKFMYDSNGLNGLDKRPQFLSYLPGRMYHSINGHVGSPVRVPRSESKDSLGSTRSEPPHYKAQRERFKIFINTNRGATLDSRIVQEKPAEWKEKTNLPLEENSNLVLQLFRHLQSNIRSDSAQETIESNSRNESKDIKPAIRPTSLPPPKRGVWNVRNGRHNLHNGLNFPPTENGYAYSRTNGHVPEVSNVENCNTYNPLDIPGNRRCFNERVLPQNAIIDGIWSNNSAFNNYTAHESIASREQIASNKPNVILRRKKATDIMSSSAIVSSKDSISEDNSVDHTPLVISRCSSLSSLTSCFQHSARSSWVSDVSQRTSAVISPSDLPDSPGVYCNSEEKPHLYEFTDKVPDANTHGLIRPRPAWPINSLPSSDSLPSSVKRMSLDSDVFMNSSEVVPLESVIDYAESDDLNTPVSTKTLPTRPPNSPISPEKDSCSSTETSSSHENNEEDGDKDSDLIAACINLGMPNNTGEISHNNSILHSKLNNLCSSLTYCRSGIPIKSGIQSRLSQSFPTSSTKPDVALGSTSGLSSLNIMPTSKCVNSTSTNVCSKPVDDNDNLIHSSNTESVERPNNNAPLDNSISSFSKPRKFATSEHNFTETEKNGLSAFESKCLSICKKYPALSQKSGFKKADSSTSLTQSTGDSRTILNEDSYQRMSTSGGSKIKTAIPQIVRPGNPNFDNEQHPKQLHVKSQNLPVYKGSSFSTVNQESIQKIPIENTSSTEENISEDVLSTSPSACEESEENDSPDAPKSVRPSEPQLRNNKVKSRKTKANRRSMEIRPPSEQSSEDDNKNAFTVSGSSSAICHISIPSSGSEEKVKEDERTKEKVSRGIIPDLLEGTVFRDELSNMGYDSDRRAQGSTRNNISRNMTDSMELRRGALMIAAELEEGIDDCTHSSTSFDLDNMKPPSCMAEMSMTSSGLSDLLSNGNGCYINGKRAVDRRRSIKRSKKLTSNRRFVLKSVRQAIANNLDVSKQKETVDKPISASTSIENISMKSSGTSDLIDNINPPSMLDDISMTNSCASLNSISSDILESRSQSLADPRSNSEMFQRLNAAAAMVQVYSRELSNIMTGSMKSSCNSDCLDLVKPPSIFQDIAEVTVEDGTEVASDPLVSDFELEEELPHDDEASVPSETVHSQFLQTSRKDADGSSENLNSSVDGDSILDRELNSVKRISSLALESQNAKIIDRNSIQHSFSNIISGELASGIAASHDFNEIESEEAASNSNQISSLPAIRRGPRIVKPINRETVRQMQEKKNAEKSIRTIRGKAPVNKPRNLLQQVTTSRLNGNTKTAVTKTSSPIVSGVRPTRTSALRASQNKQTIGKPLGGRTSPRSFLSKPPAINRAPKIVKQPAVKTNSFSSDSKTTTQSVEIQQRPSPPVKQNTFTKEESAPKVPTASSPDSDDLPFEQTGDDQNNNDKTCTGMVTSPSTNGLKAHDRKLSFSTPPTNVISQTNRTVQRKLSAPLQRKNSEKTGLPLSPSSHSLAHDDKTGRKFSDKRSPNGSNIARTTAVGSRTASTNSLSSLSSNSLSVKKSNSQKDVPSKISSIWKRSESSSSNSPVTENSNGDKAIPGSSRNRILSSRSTTLRSNSVTPPATKGIPRSSTYEKISKPATNITDKPKQQTTLQNIKSKQTVSVVSKPAPKRYQPPTSKPSGGPRIVKPVTPRPKVGAITSKSLRQSNYSPFSDMRSHAISSGPSACISVERTSRSSHDANVSIPLVTAPFAYAAQEINSVKRGNKINEDSTTNEEHSTQNVHSGPFSITNQDSESENSDKEYA